MATDSLTQAVILAGGQGMRLRPLTDHVPKSMIRVQGRPFLEYLIAQLREQGIQRVLLLVGYLAGQVRVHFGDGSRFGLHIDYVEDPAEALTGTRMRSAASHLDERFLLMYCDNYWPLNLQALTRRFLETEGSALLTAYANDDEYTRNNMHVADDGRVVTYDSSRIAGDLNRVDIGYAILRREVMKELPTGNLNFERSVYPALVRRGTLQAMTTHHRYYSIGSHERLPLTEAFFAPQRAVLLDRDGVLNVRPPRAQYVRAWKEFEWLPGAMEAMRRLKAAGYRLIVITNQPGIVRGAMTHESLERIHAEMRREAEVAGAPVDAIYVCEHNWDDGCWCRKPNPGLLFQAQRDFHLDLTRTTYVGDDERDVQAGKAAGCRTALIAPGELLAWAETFLNSEKELMVHR